MMKLKIHTLEIPFFLGFYPGEKLKKTLVTFDILIEFDDTKFLKTGDFDNLMDYNDLIQTIDAKFRNSFFDLIEEVVLELSQIILKLDIISCEIKVSKQGTHENVKFVSISKTFKKNLDSEEKKLD